MALKEHVTSKHADLLVCLLQVSQAGIRNVASKVFRHLHELDLNFHLNRQTGALNRVIDRGTRGINFILSSMLFNVVPTALEFALVSGVLYVKCGPAFAGLTAATVVAYATFTVAVTSWRTQFRKQMNKMDSEVWQFPAFLALILAWLCGYRNMCPLLPVSYLKDYAGPIAGRLACD